MPLVGAALSVAVTKVTLAGILLLTTTPVAVTGPAGSILIYKTDIFHRGSNFKAPGRSRFVMPVDFKARGWRWQGKMAWPDHANNPGWKEAMTWMTPRQRDLFGFPPPGDPYWNAQTLSDVQMRYPDMDMSPYAKGVEVVLETASAG